MTRLLAAIAATVMVGGLATTAMADGDAEEGEKVFRKCKACHMVGEDAKNRVGPVLNGIVEGEIAADPDFKYSDALIEKRDAGETWTEENLHAFLEKPKDWAPGTKMTYAGLKDEEDRNNLIAYLATFEAEEE